MEGLGTFSSRYNKATYNSSAGVFLPPQIKICFSPYFKPGNHLLEESISRKEKISISEARETILYFANFIKRAINWNDYIKIPGLGIIHRESDQQITMTTFEEFPENNIGNGLYAISI